jgi:hypothetical protein
MQKDKTLTKAPDCETDLIVYFVFSPDSGPGHRVLDDEYIQAFGGIHAIERSLEKESYWFARLGQIQGKLNSNGFTFREDQITALPWPLESAWRTGRRNPAYRGTELDRFVFRGIFQSVDRMLFEWKWAEAGIINAYALKELQISSEHLSRLAGVLCSLGRVHDVAPVTAVKYWYHPAWSEVRLTDADMILSEYRFEVPFEIRWSAGDGLISANVMRVSRC